MTVNDLLRAPLLALLQFQASTPADSLSREDRATMVQRLAAFGPWCQAHARGRIWSVAEKALWDRVAHALVTSAAAQPSVALKTEEHVDLRAGAMLHDVALLLRPGGVSGDESLELDAAIRWWQGARRAGLPVESDFGECWRAVEWMALQQHLLRLAEGSIESTGETGTEAVLLAGVTKVALRYGPLKPLLQLLPVQPGAELSAGYTF